MKQRLLIAAMFLLAGVVVNMAAAWGFILAFPPPTKYRPIYLPSDLETQAWWHDNRPASVTEGLAGVEIQGRFGWRCCVYMGDCDGRWVILPSGVIRGAGRSPDTAFCRQKSAGFPMMSLQGTQWTRHYFGTRPSERLAQSGLTPAIGRLDYPFRPIWTGFAVNTVFYATILWLLIRGPFATRRLIRLRRGLCPACAYPRGESDVCSECGKALPGRAEVAT